jgi:hypothetical protein
VTRLNEVSRAISIIFFLEIVTLCLIASWLLINFETTILLLIFNFMFVSLTFQLNGTLTQKLGLLAIGNALGLFCNFTFVSLGIVGNEFIGQGFNVLYAIFYPIGNTLWIVAFWSLSLTALPKPANFKPEINK